MCDRPAVTNVSTPVVLLGALHESARSPGTEEEVRGEMPMISMLVATSGFVWALGVFVVVVLFALWIYCLFDVLVRSSRGPGAKALWALALVLLAPFAIVAYLLVGRRR